MEHRWRTECIGPRDIDVPSRAYQDNVDMRLEQLVGVRYGDRLECTSCKYRRSERTERENEPTPVPSRDGFVVVITVVVLRLHLHSG